MGHETLAQLVNDAQHFLGTHWGRSFLHVPGDDPDRFAHLLGLADIERLLTAAPISADLVRLYRDGQAEPRESYTERVRTASHVEHEFVAAERVYELFGSGATVVISAADRMWPSVRYLCRQLSEELFHPVEAYLFVTPAATAGLAPHIDHEATFLLQLEGTKFWTLYPRISEHPERTTPLSPDTDSTEVVELRAGDLLYLPPGVPHVGAAGADSISAHLNLSVTLISWRQALLHAMSALMDDALFRAPLPAPLESSPEDVALAWDQRLDRLRAGLAELCLSSLYARPDERSSPALTRFTAPSGVGVQ